MDPHRLGQTLVAEGLITDEQLEMAFHEGKGNGLTLLQGLVKLKFIEELPLVNFLAHQFGLETIDLSHTTPNGQAGQLVPAEIAKRFRLVPLQGDRQTLKLAVENPGDVDQQELKRAVRLPANATLELLVAPISQISEALNALYPAETPIAGPKQPEVTETLDPASLIEQMSSNVEVASTDLEAEEYSVEAANEAPVKRICNYIIHEAVKRGASDIHLNPTAKGLVVRYRIDGTLQITPSPPPALRRSIIARYKVMANMDITERRKPQDGRIKIKVHEKTIDLRVSVIPQMDGENVVMRILDQSSLQLDLKKLGFEEEELRIYHEAISSPYGLILHTGPTGSGKTTTLYSALNALYDPKRSFVTLEDPVEYEMPGITQVQMDSEVGLDFATALRSALRQDPNIMMVGEIRDMETAKIAIQAALTGHLLFSTLHTNDAPSTIARLIDIGIEPGYVGTAVRLIVAQRLMKRICLHCRTPYIPTEDDLKKLEVTAKELNDGTFFKSTGCPRCDMTGYKGRLGIYEMLRNTPEIQELIYNRADTSTIRNAAEAQGMRSLRNLALEKWRAGQTTVQEVQRVTMGGD